MSVPLFPAAIPLSYWWGVSVGRANKYAMRLGRAQGVAVRALGACALHGPDAELGTGPRGTTFRGAQLLAVAAAGPLAFIFGCGEVVRRVEGVVVRRRCGRRQALQLCIAPVVPAGIFHRAYPQLGSLVSHGPDSHASG